jgi:hypothetical protein
MDGKKMSDKRRVNIFFCGNSGEVNCDLLVTPEVRITQRDGVAQIALGGHCLEIEMPEELLEQIRGH